MFDRGTVGRHPQFTGAELAALQALRTQYRSARPGFTDRELACLEFMRWLVRHPDWDRALDLPASVAVLT